jgi:hypothetical protein
MQKFLLWLLNKLNKNPNCYAFIDNGKYFSREFLEAEKPTLSIGNFLYKMDLMDRCMIDKSKGVRVIENYSIRRAADDEIKDITHLND